MTRLSRRAERQIAALLRHYDELDRFEARVALIAAIDRAIVLIGSNPGASLPAPRPYPNLAWPGRARVKSGRYWVAYRLTDPPAVWAMFFNRALSGKDFRVGRSAWVACWRGLGRVALG